MQCRFLVFVAFIFLIISPADALECIPIRTAAQHPTSQECIYVDNACDVPNGWTVVSYCPEEDIEFFQADNYIPSIGLLFGLIVGILFLLLGIRRIASAFSHAEEESTEERTSSKGAYDILLALRSAVGKISSSIHQRLFSWKMKHQLLREKERSVHRRELSEVSKAVGHSLFRVRNRFAQRPSSGRKMEGPFLSSQPSVAFSSVQNTNQINRSKGTNWEAFKKTLSDIESLDKKKNRKA